MKFEPVTSRFFEQATESLAYQLLDLVLVHESPEGLVAGRIVECEMYQGPDDKGAHSFGGKPTPRTAVMYGPPGHAYIYLIYGMYYCFNVVTGEAGLPHAILVRALEPLVGVDVMLSRTRNKSVASNRLAAGPGKLCQVLGIDRRLNAHALWRPPLYLARPMSRWPTYQVARGPRINIGYAGEAQAWPWRFWVVGHPAVSVKAPPVRVESPADRTEEGEHA
ncbi:MAG: DNA-3-methyladenine glycosylase [Firmicutes bacterium]|nr:DNA-3-methyladenine glycosylase [Bacillota bacterium]